MIKTYITPCLLGLAMGTSSLLAPLDLKNFNKDFDKIKTSALNKGTGEAPFLEKKTRLLKLPLNLVNQKLTGCYFFSKKYRNTLKEEQYCLISALVDEGILEYCQSTRQFIKTSKVFKEISPKAYEGHSDSDSEPDYWMVKENYRAQAINHVCGYIVTNLLCKFLSSLFSFLDEEKACSFGALYEDSINLCNILQKNFDKKEKDIKNQIQKLKTNFTLLHNKLYNLEKEFCSSRHIKKKHFDYKKNYDEFFDYKISDRIYDLRSMFHRHDIFDGQEHNSLDRILHEFHSVNDDISQGKKKLDNELQEIRQNFYKKFSNTQNQLSVVLTQFIENMNTIFFQNYSCNILNVYRNEENHKFGLSICLGKDPKDNKTVFTPWEKENLDPEEKDRHFVMKILFKKFLTYKEYKFLMDYIVQEKEYKISHRGCLYPLFFESTFDYSWASYENYNNGFSYGIHFFNLLYLNPNINCTNLPYCYDEFNPMESNILLQIRNTFFSSGVENPENFEDTKRYLMSFYGKMHSINLLSEKIDNTLENLKIMKFFFLIDFKNKNSDFFYNYYNHENDGMDKIFENKILFIRKIWPLMNNESKNLYTHFVLCEKYSFYEFIQDLMEENIHYSISFHDNKIDYYTLLDGFLNTATHLLNAIQILLPQGKIYNTHDHNCSHFSRGFVKKNHNNFSIKNFNDFFGLKIKKLIALENIQK